MKIALIDNRDSFVYNLVDALAGYDCTVFRNSVPVDTVLASNPDLIVLSPGPGHPRDAGTMMELIERAAGRIPLFGICLGFQALLEFHGGAVGPCGPEHGRSTPITLAANHPVFERLDLAVARYHSLGCTHAPGMTTLATVPTRAGNVIMAAEAPGMFGVQFHPESILTPDGPHMLERIVAHLTGGSR